MVVVLLLTAPIAAFIVWRRRRARRRVEEEAGLVDPVAWLRDAIATTARSHAFFLAVAIVAGLVALGVALSILALPCGDGPVRTIVGTANPVQSDGAARFAPGFATARVARIEENVGLAQRVMYVAPVRLALDWARGADRAAGAGRAGDRASLQAPGAAAARRAGLTGRGIERGAAASIGKPRSAPRKAQRRLNHPR